MVSSFLKPDNGWLSFQHIFIFRIAAQQNASGVFRELSDNPAIHSECGDGSGKNRVAAMKNADF